MSHASSVCEAQRQKLEAEFSRRMGCDREDYDDNGCEFERRISVKSLILVLTLRCSSNVLELFMQEMGNFPLHSYIEATRRRTEWKANLERIS